MNRQRDHIRHGMNSSRNHVKAKLALSGMTVIILTSTYTMFTILIHVIYLRREGGTILHRSPLFRHR